MRALARVLGAAPRDARSLDLRRRWQLARPLVGAYWLALAAALILFAAARPDSTALGDVWLGAVAGSLLGNLLALTNVRAWIAVVVVGMASPFLVAMMAPFSPGPELWSTFLPALLCGYLLFGARTALAAFWFPAMLLTLTLIDRLDGDDAAAGLDARAVLVQALIALAFLLLLSMLERRRIALWRSVGNVKLVAGTTAILREPPARAAARAGWSLVTVALAAGLTAWIAPRLWKGETLSGPLVSQLAPGAGAVAGGALPCCPVAVHQPRAHVREYLDVASGVAHPPPRPGIDCASCNGAVPGAGAVAAQPAGVDVAPFASSAPAASAAGVAVAANDPAPPVPPAPIAPVVPAAHERPRPRTHSPSLTPPPAPAPAPAPARVADAPPPRAVAPSPLPAAAPARPAYAPPPPPNDDAIVRWLVAFVFAVAFVLLVSLLLRPLRRAVTLRHLRRPYWPEPLQQRISNLWQLALVGLRDAGLRTSAGELPEELARRAPYRDADTCAEILRRARHGLGLDDADVETMRRAAEATFGAARESLGGVARAASWLRWPLL